MKKRIKKIAEREKKLEHKVSDLKKRISELEKLSPAKKNSFVRFEKPSNEFSLTQKQRELLHEMDEKIVDVLLSTEDALNYKPKRK